MPKRDNVAPPASLQIVAQYAAALAAQDSAAMAAPARSAFYFDITPQEHRSRLTPDRQWILMTGGDPRTETNHIYLLDVSDLAPTEGIPEV